MDKIKKFFSNPVVQFVGWPGIIAVITWILTHLVNIPIWEIWLAILFGVGCSFWILNQLKLWRNSNRKGFREKSDAEIETILRKWLDKRHYASSSTLDDQSLFHIVATDKQGRKLNIFKPKENSSVIFIRLAIEEKEIARIAQPHQNAARFMVGIEMARIGLLCNSSPPMHIDQELQCDDFLTESSFWNAIDKIRQGHVLISANFKLAVIEAAKDKQIRSTNEQVSDNKDTNNKQ